MLAAASRLRHWASCARRAALLVATTACLVACGGGGGGSSGGGGSTPVTPTPPAPVDPLLALGNGDGFQTLLQAQAVNPAGSGGGTSETPTTLTVHYRRTAADYSGWQLHSWGAAKDPGWGVGNNATGTDSFGVVFEVPLAASSGEVGYLFHKGDDKDHGGTDQKYVLKAGKNEIWRIQGDGASYTANPLGAAAPDLTTIRVHYKRFDANYAAWGLHLWNGSGLDSSRLPGVVIEQWNAAAAFSKMPAYAAAAGEVVFEIPVLNPKADASRKSLEFIIHGQAPNENDKDGRSDNIRIDFGGLVVKNQMAEVWLVQQDATVYQAAPDTRSASTTDARAFWLNRQLIQWPRVDGSGTVKLYYSATGQAVAPKDGKVAGAEGSLTLERFSGAVPAALAERFKFVAPGAVMSVKTADLAQLPDLLKKQVLLVQEDASGNVQNATTAQVAGALDDLYAAAANVTDLGARIANGSTTFKVWAPTAQSVTVFTYANGTADASTADKLAFDPATGIWSITKSGDLSGKYYKFAVEVFARGTGLVRNLVTDPYSLSLSDNSRRSYIANLDAAALKPAGWDQSTPPAKVAAAPDMSIYELHLRDFSANDPTVSAANRGKYLAFTESGSNGMKHLKALADAGLTDVHLLPVFDLASVPETGCSTPVPTGAADAETQQAAVAASAGNDCFNWGYDPYHYTAPEGSYASDASDGARRVLEFRQMVMALNAAGLRVGMDVVYNHTTASGQNAKSVLDRIVPGYYHRYNAAGAIETSTCCDNTATENLMMGKLMVDSTIVWARDYHISSFRFDVMGHQPRSVMEQLKSKVAAAAGRPVQLLGEGWNFGEVENGARFVQASMWSLNGSGIGSFNPFIRDAVRGGSPFDSGNALIANQGWINGLWFDPNAQGGGKSKTDLMWQGDLIKAGLAGSIRSFSMKTHWDAQVTLDQLNGAGFVTDPSEVVNYVENHDNQTLFDTNAYKLPITTSREDRARVQMLGAALTMFSQGIPYFHAGVDTLRSKSLDRNSYDAGDWFNRLDWSHADNFFGTGLPMKTENQDSWTVMKPLLANAAIKPTASEIAWTRDAFRDLLKLRASSTLLRLRTADDIKARLSFLNTGAAQLPTVLAARIDGTGYAGAGFKEIIYLVNADKQAQTLTVDALKGRAYQLHPVHLAPGAADRRVAAEASFDAGSGRFVVPARSALVWVLN